MARNRYYVSQHWLRLKKACHARDGYHCMVPGCGSREGLVCDHVVTRPNLDRPTAYDVLDNVRTLCQRCDRQVKERPGGDRPRQGTPRNTGCDVNGWPADPTHFWRV